MNKGFTVRWLNCGRMFWFEAKMKRDDTGFKTWVAQGWLEEFENQKLCRSIFGNDFQSKWEFSTEIYQSTWNIRITYMHLLIVSQ